jgi:hypothetical protein
MQMVMAWMSRIHFLAQTFIFITMVSRLVLGVSSLLVNECMGIFTHGYSGQKLKLTTYPYLAPSLRMHGTSHLLLLHPWNSNYTQGHFCLQLCVINTLCLFVRVLIMITLNTVSLYLGCTTHQRVQKGCPYCQLGLVDHCIHAGSKGFSMT